MRAESGRDALEALRELKLRGEQVAAILADYRMPEMNGIEFLEHAMDLDPHARRRAAHRLRRHRRRDPRDQRRRRRPLPAQAVGPAGGEALPGRRRAARDVARGRPAAGSTRSGSSATGGRAAASQRATSSPATRCPTAGTPSTTPEGERLLAAAGRDASDVPLVVTPDGTALSQPERRRARRGGRAHHRPGEPTSTTSSSSAAARPASARRCTGRRRGCAPCSSSGRPPAGRPGRARASRTTSASRTACPAPSSPTARGGRRRSSAPRCSPRATSSRWRSAARPASSGSPTAARSPRTRSCWPPGCRTGSSTRPGVDELTGRGVFYGSAATEAPACAGQDVYIVGGANSAGPGGGVLLPARAHGHAAGARRRAWRRRCRRT